MASAKDIRVEPIASADARKAIRRWHYSGKVVNNSQLHLGVFLDGRLQGAMQFGPPLDRGKLLGLVRGTSWNGFLELNRLAFSDTLPRNSESRALSVAMRMLRRHAPHVQWLVSFADGAQSGDGTIYRAAGFVLTGLRRNTSLWKGPDGDVSDDITIKSGSCERRTGEYRTSLTDNRSKRVQATALQIVNRVTATKGGHVARENGAASMKAYKDAGFRPIPGFQLRYVYFLDPTARERLTVPVIPFARIDELGAGMYRGKPRTRAGSIGSDAADFRSAKGGAHPTPALHAVAV